MNLSKKITTNSVIRHCYCYTKTLIKGASLKKKAEKMLSEFGGQYVDEKEQIIHDMIRMYRLYGYRFDEYLSFHFPEKGMEERRQFVADWEHFGYSYKMNKPSKDHLFVDKYETYNRFKKYYKRKVFLVNQDTSYKDFSEFSDGLASFAVKPLNASLGRGFQIIQGFKDEKDFLDFKSQMGGVFLAEEVISQDLRMEKLHPQSVNTVRMPTIRFDDETLVMHPFLRIGRGDSRVDNAGAGGFICTLDVTTGVVKACADEHGTPYDTHPDTGERIIGFQVPRWEEAVAFSKEIAQVVPGYRFVSWDIALSENGWVIVEGNKCGQFVWQYPDQEGFRNELDMYIKRIRK